MICDFCAKTLTTQKELVAHYGQTHHDVIMGLSCSNTYCLTESADHTCTFKCGIGSCLSRHLRLHTPRELVDQFLTLKARPQDAQKSKTSDVFFIECEHEQINNANKWVRI